MTKKTKTRLDKKESIAKRFKKPTGIKGLDEVLEGGFQNGRTILINGSTGTGKTVFLNEFIYRGITEYNEAGVFVTFEEKPEYIMANVEQLGWKYKQYIKEGKLLFVDMSSDIEAINVQLNESIDLTPIISRIFYAVKKIKAKRIVIDNIGSLYDRFPNKNNIRDLMLKLIWSLNDLNIRCLMSSETREEGVKFSRFGVEDFVADGVIGLILDLNDQYFKRKLFVRKIRGEKYRSGMVEFEITENGIEVYPKIPQEIIISQTKLNVKKKFGIAKLDDFISGGVPEGHMMLISGNTGAGKSIMGLHFLMEGLKNNEGVVMVALEEPVGQIKKNAEQFGWNLSPYEKKGKLSFVTSSLLDIRADRLLYQIIEACKKTNASRVIIDSISTLSSSTFDSDKVRQFLIQIANYFKGNGITCVCNYLSGSNFGAVKGQLLSLTETNNLKLSSVMDGVILLLYVEREQSVSKLVTVLKLRGSSHSKNIYTFEIGKEGIIIGDKFSK